MDHITHSSQITPAFVREAYSLLRQSIIHVEQDDIDFDEEELEGERPGGVGPHAAAGEEEVIQDVEMSAAELEAFDRIDESHNESMGVHDTTANTLTAERGHAAPTSPSSQAVVDGTATSAPAPKRRMVITHDKYMTLQSLIVLHLSAVERETGKGLDRDELIDWYLEVKEAEIQDLDELEYEKELITKMLRKLVKVCSNINVSVVDWLTDDLDNRITT